MEANESLLFALLTAAQSVRLVVTHLNVISDAVDEVALPQSTTLVFRRHISFLDAAVIVYKRFSLMTLAQGVFRGYFNDILVMNPYFA